MKIKPSVGTSHPVQRLAAYASVREPPNLRNNGPHIPRHTFCSHLAMHGAAPRAIQEFAGRQDIGTTQRYMHLRPTAKGSAIDLFEQPPAANVRGGMFRASSSRWARRTGVRSSLS
jgi:integrase